MNFFIILLGLSVVICENLIDLKLAEDLKKTVTWEVANPNTNVLRNITKERFKRMLINSLPVELRTEQPKINGTEQFPFYKDDIEDNVVHGNTGKLPDKFSWYEEWPECIHSGRDQGADCGSCWAFAIANHLSDRFCMWGEDVILSVQNLLECDTRNKCCEGGVDVNAYKFFMETGVVEEKCRPYDIKCNQCRSTNCKKHKCKKNSAWFSSSIEKSKQEIYYNGPVQAIFSVYADFSNYQSGVYYHTQGEFLGIHTVEVLGWGVENGMKYWLCKNCWGDDWGANSFFKIKMGECGIDDYMSSCLPDV